MPRREDGCRKADRVLWYTEGLGCRSSCKKCPFENEPEKCPRGIKEWEWGRRGILYSFEVYQMYFGAGEQDFSKTAEKLHVSVETVKRHLDDWFIYPERDPDYLVYRNKQIRERHAEGKTVKEISKDFRLSERTIQRIVAKDYPRRRPGRPKKMTKV